MNSLIATVRLDIGRGFKNPILKIYSQTDIQALIHSFVIEEQLPIHTKDLIFIQIQKQLSKHSISIKSSYDCQKDQDSTVIQEESQTLDLSSGKFQCSQNNTPKYIRTLEPYSPIQMLSKQSTQSKYNSFPDLRILGEGTHAKKSKPIKKTSEGKREECLSFKELKNKKVKQIFNLLKGDCIGSFLDSDLMSFKEFNRHTLEQLEIMFLEFEDSDFEGLDEQKFVSVVRRLNFIEKLYMVFNRQGKM